MYLSKLEIFGFKSFAHKVHFKFTDGITAIIGPNGCGKSNIVDAIRWVLGEQRPSLLRLDKMENVIFNGTATRKPLSMAEVSIYIENTKNILPSVYSEVKITRRLYRSGESEYLINNHPVRLKDVIDLFADTGMGSDAYSVIELKMVEQILSENAEERRRLFEEAAGIKKYKIRRKAALRKLETTDQELIRLNDVIAEVQKNVNSLSRQVGKARRYHQLKQDMQRVEIQIFQLKKQNHEQDLIPLKQELEQVRQTRERLGKEVNLGEAELEKMRVKGIDLEHQFREIATRLNQADDKIRQIQQQSQLFDQKILSLNQNIEKAQSEISEYQQRIQEIHQQLEQLSRDKETIAAQAAEKQAIYQTKANIQLEAELKLEEIKKKYSTFRKENLNILNKGAEQKEEFQRISIQIKSYDEQQKRLLDLRQKLEEDLQQKQMECDQFQTEYQEAVDEITLYQKEAEHLQKTLEHLLKEQIPLEDQQNKIIGLIEKTRNQLEFVGNLIHSYEGFSESVQYVMSHKENFSGLIDTLANMVDAPEEYRPAIESYLQEIANYLVVDKIDTARQILSEIRSRQKGRLTLIPLPILNTSNNKSVQFEADEEGAIPLLKIVSYDPRFQDLFKLLFEKVILVKDIDAALTWHEKYPQFRYLTRNGEFIGDWGQITGGNYNSNLQLIGRKQQYKKLKEELENYQKKHRDISQKLEKIKKEYQQKDNKLAEFKDLIEKQKQRVTELQQQVRQAEYEQKRTAERAAEIEQEIDTLKQQMDILQQNFDKLKPQVDEAERQQRLYLEKESQLNKAAEEAERNYRQISREVQELQIDYLNTQGRLHEMEQKEQYLNNSLQEIYQLIERARKSIETYQEEIVQLSQENTKKKRLLDELFKERDKIEVEKLEVENNYQGLKSVIMSKEEELKKKHRRWNQAAERLRELELSIQELELKIKNNQEQIKEKYGGETVSKLLEEYPVPANVALHQLQEQYAEYRRKFESLGEVNPLAIKEYEREKERLDFLSSQREDLLKAKQELLTTIRKLNKTAYNMFMETFAKINTNFKSVFSKFFEGGEAELVLEENDDPLEAKININVRIKGRRLSTLNLLSAGEKTLTAISLLFAIYLVKPSPFCILDEVDAPLDDVNIIRYTHALKEFSRNTQFILVTHNKMTMQAAQAMYGITMEEVGVSKVVSVRFD